MCCICAMLFGLGEFVILLLVLVAVLPMFRRGSNALEDGEAGDTCAFGGGTGEEGVVVLLPFMNPNEDAGAEGGEGIPAATAAAVELSDGCTTVSTLTSALLIFILPNKSPDPLPDTTGTVVAAGATFISMPNPPSKSSCC